MRYLLVPGAYHGAWCWRPFIDVLAARGHDALAVDPPSPAAGGSAWRVSLRDGANAIGRAAEAIGSPVHLVAHSMGGAAASNAVEMAPHLYASITYVAAFLLPSGGRVMATTLTSASKSRMASASRPHLLRGEMTISSHDARELFYGRCSPDVADWAVEQISPQPLRPGLGRIRTSAARWGSVPRNYVFTEQDDVFPLEVQHRMESRLPCAQTRSIATDHSPFLSEPDALADALIGMTAPPAVERGARH